MHFALRNDTFTLMESTALVKGIGLLEALSSSGGEAALGQLAEMAGVAKPTAHRILAALMALGYVERQGAGIYRLTGRLSLVARGLSYSHLVEAAEAVLQRLATETGETVNLGVLRQQGIVYLRVLESTHALRRVATPDEVDPFYCTALGRAIVAYLPEPQRERLLRTASLEPRTEHTIIEADALREQFAQVRENGYALEMDQTDLGVTCIGAPLFQHDQVVAAISLSVPTARSDDQRRAQLIDAVRAAATAMTDKLNTSTGATR